MSHTRKFHLKATHVPTALKGALVGLALVASPLIGACADDGLATLRVALSVEAQQSFELFVFEGSPGADLSGSTAFESGCQQRRSTVLELSDLPTSADYSIVYKAYGDTACAGAPIAFGFRGGIELAKGDGLYVHVPVYETGAGTLLPVDLNLSSLGATPTASCDTPDICGGAATAGCITSGDRAWCVPLCRTDDDCSSLHSEAVCDVDTSWCMLASPWPLNASEPRLLGRAMTRPNGDVVVVGGLTPATNGKLGVTKFPVERFDAATGVFGSFDLAGFDARPGAYFGFAQFGPDSAVVAGGLSGANRFDKGTGVDADGRANGVDKAFVIDFATGRAVSAQLGRVVIDPSVFVIDPQHFWVVGGHEGRPSDAMAGATSTSLCAVDAVGELSCAKGPSLAAGRIAPAILCVVESADVCQRALVVGGNNQGGPVAELVELSGKEIVLPAVTAVGLPNVLLRPVFCGEQLVGGSTPSGAVSALLLDLSALDEGKLGVVAADQESPPVPRWAGHSADGCGLAAGGLDGPSAMGKSAWTGTGGALSLEKGNLGTGRLGAAVGRIGAGALAGSWLVLGGSELDGGVRVIKGAEVWRP